MHKSYKYRLSPNKEQAEKLQWVLDHCRELYNAALQERRDAYAIIKQHPSYYDLAWRRQATKDTRINFFSQAAQVAAIRETCQEYYDIPVAVLRDALKRVEHACQAFYRRCKQGDNPGYPRFQGKVRYDSFTYPNMDGLKVKKKHVTLSRIGDIKITLHRPIEGRIKTCTIKREGSHWSIAFCCEVETETLPVSYEDVGIDLGVTHLAALSNGETIDNPRHYRRAEKKLATLQQALSRKKRGSNRRHKAVQSVGKAHRKVSSQRKDYLHKVSRHLVNRYQMIVFEELQTTNMSKRAKPKQDEEGNYLPNGGSAKSGLNKSIRDAGWAMLVSMVTSKAECAGRTVLQVNPRYTSQICSGCGTVKKKELSERWHSCICGTELDRDTNAAINILRLGSNLQSEKVVKASA